MSAPASPRALQIFMRVVQLRRWIAGAFVLLTVAGVYGALRVPDDLAIEHLVVPGDPLARATRDFERVFPTGEQALLVLESADPLSPASLSAADNLERALARIPGVEPHSLLTLYRLAIPGAPASAVEADRVRAFATGTTLFRRAGLSGEHYLGIALDLRVQSPAERDRALAAIDLQLRPLEAAGSPFTAVRRVGSPWLNAWLEQQTGLATKRFMPLFGVFLLTLVFVVYRSWRTLGAVVLTLASVVAIAMGLGDLLGFSHTVVSALVPLTVMVTTTATLVYIHSRYLDPDEATSPLEHHARALADKFLPCTASILATAAGFAALAVSAIRPVREMGLWTAGGLLVAWIASFTLFPALQSLLEVPRRPAWKPAGASFEGFTGLLVPWTRRYRWALVATAIVSMICGAAALFGIPRHIAPLPLETDALSYVNPHERVAQDTRHFRQLSGLDVVDLWLQTAPGHAMDPDFLRAVQQFSEALERDPRITAVDGPTSVLQWARYVQSRSDQLPTEPSAWPKLAADLEQILLTEPGARGYVDLTDLASVRLSVRGHAELFGSPGAMRAFVEQTFAALKAQEPALRAVTARAVGKAVLGATVSEHLVPTLIESFALTAGVIFVAFLFVFRSPAGRLMAMIPSLFAILAVFLVMRVSGIPLNIATILLGSTVLGATENDQIHFFYHFQQGRSLGSTSEALRHALIVAGRPIVFATLINASGFLALALSDLPPMRQFGIVTATAFVLALAADFTALPGALWILSRRGGS
ncbi:MAG TPA: MMPL family transporter [Steroidobacteraceae bacterium]|jgi:predicted RND superfamily exporter protein|nr:MMPL family transporter [Steroidobacteraceae bacterium]